MRLRGPVMAIVWEQWRSVRGMVFAVTGIGLALMGGLHLLAVNPKGRALLTYSDPIVASGAIVVVCVLLLFDTDRWEATGLRASLRQWQLPVGRWRYLALHILVRLCAIGVVAVVFGQGLLVVNGYRGGGQTAYSPVSLAAIAVTMLALLFAVSAIVGRYARPGGGLVPTLLIWLLLCAAGAYGAASRWPEETLEPGVALVWASLISLVCTGLAVADASSPGRTSVFERLRAKPAPARAAAYWPGRFGSPTEAQAWHERQRHGLVIPMLTLLGLLLSLVLAMIMNSRGRGFGPFLLGGRDPALFRFAITLGLWGWFLLPVAAAFAGLARLSQEWNERRSNRVPYARLMPFSPVKACSLRLKSSYQWLRLTALLLGTCLAGALLILSAMATPREILTEVSTACGVGNWWPVLILLWMGVILTVSWSLYWLTIPLLALVLWLGAMAASAFLVGLVHGAQQSPDLWKAFILLIPSVAALAATIWGTVRAAGRHYLELSPTLAIALSSCLVFGLLAALELADADSLLLTVPAVTGTLFVVAGGVWLRTRWRRESLLPGMYLGLLLAGWSTFLLLQAQVPLNRLLDGIEVAAFSAAGLLPVFAGTFHACWAEHIRYR